LRNPLSILLSFQLQRRSECNRFARSFFSEARALPSRNYFDTILGVSPSNAAGVSATPGSATKVKIADDLTNRSSQPLAVAMRRFDFMKQLWMFATLAAASGGSALSR
jgi:hypothetical protein